MKNYIEASTEAGKSFYLKFKDRGKVVMLNLLKFRDVADYSKFDTLKPEQDISGEDAYKLYMEHTLPIIKKAGSRIIFYGSSAAFLIGPEYEKWDAVLLVEHESVEKFMGFANDKTYLATSVHRTAALEDSRLLPISESKLL